MSYFHKLASNRRQINTSTLQMVGPSGNALVEELKRKVAESFEDRFKSSKCFHMANWDVNFPSLERVELESLEMPFSEEEVHRELMDADGGRAPSPDGFTFKFAQHFVRSSKVR